MSITSYIAFALMLFDAIVARAMWPYNVAILCGRAMWPYSLWLMRVALQALLIGGHPSCPLAGRT